MHSDTRSHRLFSLAVSSFAALLSIGPPASASAQSNAPQAPARELRVMTYNIKHGRSNAACTQPTPSPGQPPFADCGLDLPGTIDAIRAHAPEVVALQEVDRFWARSASLDEPAAIAAGLEMQHTCYGANLNHQPDSHASVPHQYGTALVSRYPILECANTPITTFSGWEQRGLLRALLNVRGVPTWVFVTHLQASRTSGGVFQSAAPQRTLEVQDIMNLTGSIADPIILMGDFNAGSTSSEMKPLYTRFLDAWREAGTGSGNTSPARLTGDPTSRIDYIFVSPEVAVSSVYVPIDAQTRLASDHYPVVADIALPGSQVGVGRKEPTQPDAESDGTQEEFVEHEPGGGV